MQERWILQFCHSYYGPFLDVARQYATLFLDTPFKVLTVYLSGEESAAVRAGSASDEVLFLERSKSDIRGLKIGAMLALRKILAGRQVELVIAHRFKPIYIACLATNVPVIGVHHAFGDYRRPARRWFARSFQHRLSLLAVSNAVRDDIRSCLPAWPAERIETLHNRLDVPAVRAAVAPREQARETLGLPMEAMVIGNVGRLHQDKDQATLIAAFAQACPSLPANSLLVIIGSGRLREALEAQARDLGVADRVRLLGQVPEVRRYFSAFDLFVLSSDHEPFGMVLLEAMAANVPVMASDCGGAPEVVRAEAMRFGLRAVDQLANKLIAFFAHPNAEERQALVAAATATLDSEFSDEVAQKRFFALPMVRRVLGEREA